jgi:hypothetical protein
MSGAAGNGAAWTGAIRAWPGVGLNATAGLIPSASAISSANAALTTTTAKALPASISGLRRWLVSNSSSVAASATGTAPVSASASWSGAAL